MNDEMILVPRAELLAWAKAWLSEYDPNDGTDCVTPFDTYLLKSPVDPAAADIELLPLPMPKGDVAGGGLDWTDEEMQDYARACVAHALAQQPADPITAYYTDRNRAGWAAPRRATTADTPSSAPVDVEAVEAALQKWLDWCNKYEEEPEARSGARIVIEALTKQSPAEAQPSAPAAVDGAWDELEIIVKGYLDDPHADAEYVLRKIAALAAQPAAVDEPMVEAVRHRVGCHDGLDITPAQVRSVLKHWRIESRAALHGGES